MREQPVPPSGESAATDGADRSTSAQSDLPPCPLPAIFDPSRMIGIIRRKAMIRELAAAYREECLASCEELLELQKKWDEPYIELKPPQEEKKKKKKKKEASRPPKRQKKSR
ncbi:hypothetical protein SAY86_006653 [Trapa natans]|uniref:Uncharacterized protein n=1 Tax=Trapa natans TaxID=22666 RepID=A0AAN7LCI5_TRANT|nr:hypothetical protein SAY86_006653 [Trapa natans]